MSENEHEMRNQEEHEDMDLKEDFSGFTEMSVKNTEPPTQPPPKIDVSEAVAQAQSQQREHHQPHQPHQPHQQPEEMDGNQGVPQLPGVPRGMPHPGMMGMPPRPPQRPSFWQTLMSRGLIILAIAAVGIFVWWWWSKNNGGGNGPVEAAEAAVNAARKTVVEPIQKALKLPPSL